MQLGHRRIGFLGGDPQMATQQERLAGWRDALIEAGVVVEDRYMFPATPTRQGGREAMERALALANPPTAVACYNDIVAIGATRALLARGLTPGRDVAVVGFDDIAEASDNWPPLTTVSGDTRGLGERCAQSLVALINREDAAGLSFIGETRLIVRDSCGAALRHRKAS